MSNTEELTFKNCKTLILTMDTEQLDELIHAIKYRRDEINRELKDNDAKEVYVYLAYAIGYNEPVQATAIIDGREVWLHGALSNYDLSPNGIIEYLQLKEPKFEKTAEWGHMGIKQTWG